MITGVSSVGSMSAGITTAAQLSQALFNKLDVNGDGVIDKAEVRAALESGEEDAGRLQ